MPFAVTHGPEAATGRFVVTAKVGLSMAETNALFLSGDAIVSWPEGELLVSGGLEGDEGTQTPEGGIVRTGMFVSELAQFTEGLKIGYRQQAEADRAAQLIRLQLIKAGITEETRNG